MKPGIRVRTVREVCLYPDDLLPAGLIGTIEEASGTPLVAMVRLDQRRPELDEWYNRVWVWDPNPSCLGDCVPECFEPLEG